MQPSAYVRLFWPQEGKRAATAEPEFVMLVRSRSDALVRTARLLTGNWQSAEDLVQAALLRTWQRWERFDVGVRWLPRVPPNAQTLASPTNPPPRPSPPCNTNSIPSPTSTTTGSTAPTAKPAAAYAATLKATRPHNTATDTTDYRVRIDAIDRFGKLTLRHAGKLHHLGIAHANTPILMLIDDHTVNVINPATGQHLASHTIDPHHNYWRNNQKNPGRWLGSTTS